MADRRCLICRDKIEVPWGSVCFGCRLDALVPADYMRKERYSYDPAFAQINATAHPPTGVEILDSTPVRLSQKMILKNAKMPYGKGE